MVSADYIHIIFIANFTLPVPS